MLRSLVLVAAAAVAFADPPIPRPSPELNVPLAGGGDFRLADLRGKVVALEFIYTTCPHCQRFSQLLDKLAREYYDRGFRAVAVAFNEDAEMRTPEFAAEFGIAFPVGICTYDEFFAYMSVPPRQVTLPHLFFIDRKGMIRAHYGGDDPFFAHGEANTRAMIETLLKERASKSRKHKN
jgi:thiol-disulfide isomerase/thioredoxin